MATWLQLVAASLSPGVNGLRGWTWSWASGGAKSANARYTPDKGKTPGRRRLGHELGFGKGPEASDSSESSQGHGMGSAGRVGSLNPVTHSLPRRLHSSVHRAIVALGILG
ncbi:hypothetical protein BKA56DRAFT_608138 [Ilyonectria sp. MPI-CAGE-AT-0026]|nr:hypothetical protein BKA56DRAFT_608138 [Ilyonectria sp. MPI-CAGE-AT-0026]